MTHPYKKIAITYQTQATREIEKSAISICKTFSAKCNFSRRNPPTGEG
jgi:hypothetical protein